MFSSAVTRSLVTGFVRTSGDRSRIKGANDATVADHYGTGSKAGMGQSGGRGMVAEVWAKVWVAVWVEEVWAKGGGEEAGDTEKMLPQGFKGSRGQGFKERLAVPVT